jgi:hypothetical protein
MNGFDLLVLALVTLAVVWANGRMKQIKRVRREISRKQARQ